MDKLIELSVLVAALLVAGSLACLPLYGWSVARFVASSLFIKIVMWVPIYLMLLGVIVGGPVPGLVLAAGIAVLAAVEYYRQTHRLRAVPWQVRMYGTVFCLCVLGMAGFFWLLPRESYVSVVTLLCFGSVLSDVVAFFFGNYLGRYPLPEWINPRKSWEGVLGQLIGGVAGVWLAASVMGIQAIWWLGLLIGVASALGDLLNSIAKRQLAVKDWAATIPGHGGVLDRCSSLAMAFVAVALVVIVLDIPIVG